MSECYYAIFGKICRRFVLSIAGSGRCIILLSSIKLGTGTLPRLQACLSGVPTRREDVLISGRSQRDAKFTQLASEERTRT